MREYALKTTRATRAARMLGAATAALLMTACGSTGPAGPVALTIAQDNRAVLAFGNLPLAFGLAGTDSPGINGDDLGCLTEAAQVDNGSTVSTYSGQVAYEATSASSSVQVTNQVDSYRTTASAIKAFQEVHAALKNCAQIEADTDGEHLSLDVTVNTAKSSTLADSQLNVTATGTGRGPRGDAPVSATFAAVRVANDTTLLFVSDIGKTPTPIGPYAKTAVDRLVAVMKGKEPPTTRISPDPS